MKWLTVAKSMLYIKKKFTEKRSFCLQLNEFFFCSYGMIYSIHVNPQMGVMRIMKILLRMRIMLYTMEYVFIPSLIHMMVLICYYNVYLYSKFLEL